MRNWGAFDPEQPVDALGRIHSLLLARTGHDFSEYKERTFQRRVQRRMQVLQTTSVEAYAERVESQPEEVGALFRDLLIGVTDFFRDPAAFQALQTLVIPKLFAQKNADDEVRVWVPGCSTGEEVYSIAMLLGEQMKTMTPPPKVQIFATDIDETALSIARAGRYPESMLKGVSPERLRRFFVHEAGTYRAVKEIREICNFSNHSVIRDPPFSRLDLISCRNLLMYLTTPLQSQIIPLFHYALRSGGYLLLGISENVSRHNELFVPIDRKSRLFRRRDLAARPTMPLRQFLPHARQRTVQPDGSRKSRSDQLRRVAAILVESFAPIYVVVDEAGQTLFFSPGTGKYLQPAPGPPSRDIVDMARPGLRADLRLALHRARETGRRVVRERVGMQIDGGVQMLSIAVEPIIEGNEIAYGIVFSERGPVRSQEDANAPGHPDGEGSIVQQIERELQETKERLQSTIEELETANEEFRSSNEELLSVNEELQSTNEEMETSKEELQSVNEELQTVNSELTSKIDELDRANSDLNNLFQSTKIATIFLDRNLVIRSFTPAVMRLFNLIPADRGRPLTDIVGRIDYPDLADDLRRVARSGEAIEQSVSLSGGAAHFLARILPYRGTNNIPDGVLLTFVDVTSIIAAEEQQKVLAAELSHRVKNTLALVSSITERTLPDGAGKTDLIGRFHALGHTHDVLSQGGWTEAALRTLLLAELAPHTAGDGGNVTVNGPPVLLKPRAALFLTLVLHELSTNAAKHGALSASAAQGHVDIAWRLVEARPRRLELTWQETGGPASDQPAKRGFGTELIERGVRFELQGEAKLELTEGHLDCTILIPENPEYFTVGGAAEDNGLKDVAS